MPLKSTLTFGHSSVLSAATGLSTPKDELTINKSYAWESGTGADQADKQYRATITLAASASQTLDLAGGITDVFGATITFVKIKKVEVYAADGNTNNVNVTRPASNGVPLFLAAGDGLGIPPGGAFAFVGPKAAGLATVTDTTAQDLTFTNSGAGSSVTFDVVIEGTSA